MTSSRAGMAYLLLLLLVLFMAVPSLATVYTVGDVSGWSLGVDYSLWTKGKTFKVGDQLVFNYGSSHTVDEVSASGYSACSASDAILTDSSGATTITLRTAGNHYFICGVPDHCSGGMRLAVNVVSGSFTYPSKSPSFSSS